MDLEENNGCWISNEVTEKSVVQNPKTKIIFEAGPDLE